MVLGPNPTDEVTLVPRASLAELIEITPTESTLLVTLTSGERNCETLTPPDASDVSLSLRVALTAGTKLATGTYPLLKPGPDPDKPYVTSTVKLKGRRQELRPGGEVTLTLVDSSPQGILEGNLKLEFAGDAEHPATRVSGHFVARFCRIDRLR
jgi:hypothetical protein